MIVELRWTPYAVPFRRPLVTSHRRWDARDGIIIEVTADDGRTGVGDAAPLPEFGTADVDTCLAALDRVAKRLVGADVDDAMRIFDSTIRDDALAPLRCGIETACLDLTAQAAGVSIARLLAAVPATRVDVSAVAGDECDAKRAAAAGFRCVKLKVGVAARDEETARVVAVRRALGPDIGLRLDANGAWTVEQAIEIIDAVAPLDIELVEQPMAAGDIDALRRVREAVTVPIAADEDVTSVEAARRLVAAGAADVLIVKPAVVGGPRRASQIIEMAAAAGAGVVVTSAMESGIGVAAALQVAAASPPRRTEGDDSKRQTANSKARTAYACGLATLELLAGDLLADGLAVESGAMSVPSGPGLGVALDRTALERYRAGPTRVVRR